MDLAQELRRLDQDHKLWKRLTKIKETATQIWEHPRLYWYTKHNIEHSNNIIRMIGEILAPLYISHESTEENPPLSAYELYILLAACYLHDIGMQNLSIDSKISADELTPKDFALIRDRHPHCSFLLIRNRTIKPVGRDEFRLPLEDDENLMVIAYVARAHGTEFFDDSCGELRRLTRHREKRNDKFRVRGELLAALLMMGDELDLNSYRAVFPADVDFSPQSLLHNYKHHYIPDAGVEDGEIPYIRRIFVRFEFPPDAKKRKYRTIRDWVLNKLKQQCHRTNEILSNNLGLRWDSIIKVEIDEDNNEFRRKLPPEVFPLLEEMRCEGQQARQPIKIHSLLAEYGRGPQEYIKNDFEDRGDVVIDHATGLMWQKSGSDKYLTYEEAHLYIEELNRQRFAGYDNWRLPTVEELLSLVEPEQRENKLDIDPIFDATQEVCWTADRRSWESAWNVAFHPGEVIWLFPPGGYVRAVRSCFGEGEEIVEKEQIPKKQPETPEQVKAK